MYHSGMDKLSISQIQQVTDWTWKTAKSFAVKNGELVDTGYGRGKWYVPYEALAGDINRRLSHIQAQQNRLINIDLSQ